MVAEGWELLEEVVKDVGARNLFQLLRLIHNMTIPPPATALPVPMDVTAVTTTTPSSSLSPVKKEGGLLGKSQS